MTHPSPALNHSTTVRPAAPEDAEELVRLRKIMLDALRPSDDVTWQPFAVADLRSRLAEPDGDLAVFVVDRPDGARARAGGAPALAACAAGTVERRLAGPGNPLGLSGHVFNVATDPGMRRRGYSRACMTALLAWYRERGVPRIDLHASVDGEPLYASLGFVRHREPAMRLSY
ncbi:GNAT family N-acetyltransferase [Streptomyces sp. TS71-3]|uniref:GNAT family N-acetyltransferase n=1 Tax=Streptomyces sp. TS71-3 TaxID=2733862 RepID=UPI001BB2FDAE|nr:GNAT family N-acetyltransferase [Streptomyces sp. TS71-3]